MGPGNSREVRGAEPRPPSADPADAWRDVHERALRLLEHRARSVMELRRRLREKCDDSSLIESVLERLQSQGLLDDASFAREFARRKVVTAGSSRRRILQELQRKGVVSAIATEAVDSLQELEGIDPGASIDRVARKKWDGLRDLDDAVRKRRIFGHLARRGYEIDDIKAVIARLEGADTDE